MGRFENAKVNRAAGGIVVRDTQSGPEVLVVHRSRYDDWTLPKGHVDEGETWADTAQREVLEETGVAAWVAGDPVTVSYVLPPVPDPVTSVPAENPTVKLVVFYPMRAPRDADIGQLDVQEVDDVAWWSLSRCAQQLTYSVERELIAKMVG